MRLFDRRWRLVIGVGSEGLDVSDLDITFDVKKTLKPIPNVATIHVMNLTASHRKALETATTLGVELHAGYKDGMSLLYLGEMAAAVTHREGPDFVTVISSGDKHGVFAGRTLRVPVGEQTNAAAAIRQLVKSLTDAGVGEGNITALNDPSVGSKMLYPAGGVLSGNTSALLSSLCKSAGLEWSIQDGKLQILKLKQALASEAFELGPDTGLVGKVEKSNKGYVKATTLLIPGLQCGSIVKFDTETALVGGYRIEKIRYHGATRTQPWYASIEARQY
jgi:hypothetical protein